MKYSITIIANLIVCFLFAQEPVNESELKKVYHHVGLHAGFTSGVGPSYRLQYNDYKFQAAFLPIVSENFDYINYGILFGKDLHHQKNTSFFIYNSYSAIHTSENSFLLLEPDDLTGNSYRNRLNIGFGAGIEQQNDNIIASLMFGYGAFLEESTRVVLNLTLEASIYYRFIK